MPKLQVDTDYHPSRSFAARFPADDELRRAGYTIHARPKNAEPVWRSPRGELVGQKRALEMLKGCKT